MMNSIRKILTMTLLLATTTQLISSDHWYSTLTNYFSSWNSSAIANAVSSTGTFIKENPHTALVGLLAASIACRLYEESCQSMGPVQTTQDSLNNGKSTPLEKTDDDSSKKDPDTIRKTSIIISAIRAKQQEKGLPIEPVNKTPFAKNNRTLPEPEQTIKNFIDKGELILLENGDYDFSDTIKKDPSTIVKTIIIPIISAITDEQQKRGFSTKLVNKTLFAKNNRTLLELLLARESIDDTTLKKMLNEIIKNQDMSLPSEMKTRVDRAFAKFLNDSLMVKLGTNPDFNPNTPAGNNNVRLLIDESMTITPWLLDHHKATRENLEQQFLRFNDLQKISKPSKQQLDDTADLNETVAALSDALFSYVKETIEKAPWKWLS